MGWMPLEEMTEQQLLDELRHADRWRISATMEMNIATARCTLIRGLLKKQFSVSV